MDLHGRSLRRGVRELGSLLGEVIVAWASDADFETVESIRTAAIDHRRGDADSRDPLYAALADLDQNRERVVVRAFTTYFELINIAEEREWLAESLRLRNPYVDPLNLLQARLLGQERRTEAEERTLRLTVKGIAAGMKNTG